MRYDALRFAAIRYDALRCYRLISDVAILYDVIAAAIAAFYYPITIYLIQGLS